MIAHRKIRGYCPYLTLRVNDYSHTTPTYAPYLIREHHQWIRNPTIVLNGLFPFLRICILHPEGQRKTEGE